ncbi:hypothetical protein TI05_01760, partial [Achromatium sp. WMS3]
MPRPRSSGFNKSPRIRSQNTQTQSSINTINAPYNFVPLASQVVIPDWGHLVSQDFPFKDGISGTIEFTVTANTPLLIGSEQTKSSEISPGVIKPFKTPDGNYAIPGSSIRGMLRSVLEIATFSKMQIVDDKRYGLRDISGRYVSDAYTDRVRSRVRTGFLRLNEKQGVPEIIPCSMVRLSHRDLEDWWPNEPKPIFRSGKSVASKYKQWLEICQRQGINNPTAIKFTSDNEAVTDIGRGNFTGFPVFTGQISAEDPRRNGRQFGVRRKGREKYRDFMFYNASPEDAFIIDTIDPAAWRDFLFIHGDEEDKPDMPWPGYWKKKFWHKQMVPIFYIQSPDRLQIGLAYMPKLAGDFSIYDMIRHSSDQHLETKLQDLANLIFGNSDDNHNLGFKSRVWCELAPATTEPTAKQEPNIILGTPHPTYFPNYIEQPASAKTQWRLSGSIAQYATYLDSRLHHAPKLRGWKRYPVRSVSNTDLKDLLSDEQLQNYKVQIQMYTLPKGTQFAGRLLIHNLKPIELGAVVWSLTFGFREESQHRLGLAKSFGFGQVSIKINNTRLNPNNPTTQAPSLMDCVQQFKTFMQQQLQTDWEQTPQISALLAMADPNYQQHFPGKLQHMVLARIPDPIPNNPNKKRTLNQFIEAKQAGLVLADYNASNRNNRNQINNTRSSKSSHSITHNTKSCNTPASATVSLQQPLSPQTWPAILLTYNPGQGTVAANQGNNRAFSDAKDQAKLLA